jgi:hypothetical protein
MTSTELLEHFILNMNEFIKEMTNPDRFHHPDLKDPEFIPFREDLTNLYFDNIVCEMNDIYFQQKNKLEEDLDFFPDQEGKKIYLHDEVSKLKVEYSTNEYNYLFTKNNFQDKFFDILTLESLLINLISIHEEIYEIYEEEPEAHINRDKINNILNLEFNEMYGMAQILIRLKLINIKLENDKVENPAPKPDLQIKEKNSLTLNQKVELLHRLIFIKNWEDLTQTRQAELINLLTDLNEDNIKKSIRKIGEKISKRSLQGQKDYDLIQKLTKDVLINN